MTNSDLSSGGEQSCSSEHPVVSVIVPAYNVEPYLKHAIDSALRQTISNIEVIVVDDASKDGTLQVARACAAEDARVKVIASPVNGGAAVARNRALDAATGDWIAILDSDDWYSPTRLEFLLAKAGEHNADMMADDLSYVTNQEPEPWTSFVKQNGDLYTTLTHIDDVFYVEQENKPWNTGVTPGFLKPIVRRSLIENNGIRYKDHMRVGEDFFFFLDCLLAGARFLFYPEPHYFYRARPDSLVTKSQLERLVQVERGLHEVLQDQRVIERPKLRQALVAKLGVCQQKLQYQSVVEPLRQKRYFKAIVEMMKNPYFFVRLAQKFLLRRPSQPA